MNSRTIAIQKLYTGEMKIFKYRLLNHFLFWLFIYSFYTLPSVISSGAIWPMAGINLMYLPLDILCVYFVIGYIIPKFLFRGKILIFTVGFTVAIAFNVIISHHLKYYIQPFLGIWVTPRHLMYDLFYSLLSNFMIIGIASAMKLLRHSFKIQLSQAEIERRTVQSELGILRSQVNPHFLFNVLNNIDALIFEDKEKASNAIFLLSKIMRFMLQESDQERVALEKEISYIEDYLELARLSFKNPEFLTFNSSGIVHQKQIPPLLFIPIIENAIKHSNKQSPSPGIEIEIKGDNGYIELSTTNYIKPGNLVVPEKNNGIGLKNVEKRLKLLYQDDYKLEINKSEKKFEVYLKVPIG